MRILILTQYFTPEITAARVRLHAFAEGLAELGHHVHVICEVPNHPAGVVHPGYGGSFRDRRRLDGFDVTYVRVWTHPTKSTVNRLLLYGTYAAAGGLVGAFSERPDVVLASSPPLPVGAAAAAVAGRHRVPWVLDVRDLWPEAAVVLGELRGRSAIRLATILERRLYRSAAAITTVTEPFRERIAGNIGAGGAERVTVIPNGTTRMWLDAGEADPPARGDDTFEWMYAGNLGIAQGLSAAIDAADVLGEGFRLVLLGDGPERVELERQATALAPGRVVFRGLVQPEVAAQEMRGADALLVSLGDRPELAKFVPSKLFDCCALGRPVVLAAAGEAPRLAESAGAACVVPPGDPAALAAAVRRLHDDAALRGELAAAGRAFARDYRRERQTERLAGVLEAVIRDRALRRRRAE